MTLFKHLAIGQRFEFAVSRPAWGLERGPWVKRSARTYYKAVDPFAADYTARQDAQQESFVGHCQVGSVNVKVTKV